MKENKMTNADILALAEADPENATEISAALVKDGRESACNKASLYATTEFVTRYLVEELDLDRNEAEDMLYDTEFNSIILDTLKDIVFVFFTALFEGGEEPTREELIEKLDEHEEFIYDYAYDHDYLQQNNSYSYER